MRSGRLTKNVVIEKDVPAEMQDGTILRADVYKPNESNRYPVLLTRTPYGKSIISSLAYGTEDFVWAAERGYVVVVQDVRGRYASDGEFHPMFIGGKFEALDGYDTVEWAASLSCCNGKVGTFGCSYDSWTQWALAHLNPPHLVAMFAGGQATKSTDWEQGGVFRTERALQWLINTLAPDARRRAGGSKPWTTEEAEKLWEADRGKWTWFLPWKNLPEEVLGSLAPHFEEWLSNHNVDYWRFHEIHQSISVPVYHYTGWYDRLNGTVDHYIGMVKNGADEKARRNQKLIIGPWTHGHDWGRRLGDVDFGREAVVNFKEVMIKWFDYWLKEIDNSVMDGPPVKIFVMGANIWRSEKEWPITRTRFVEYFLHSGGNANGQSGDGGLSPLAPGDEPSDSFIYDPRDPVMTLYLPNAHDAPRDQRLLSHRRDILAYATKPLEKELEVTGRVYVKLWASSSARDTDFIAKLIDVYPEGFAQNLCYGIVRTRFRESLDNPKLISPYDIYEYTIELQPTSNLFKKGHRLRLDVSSSDFPNFDRNHNTGAQDWEDARLMTANQTIYHEKNYPSKVILPVIL